MRSACSLIFVLFALFGLNECVVQNASVSFVYKSDAVFKCFDNFTGNFYKTDSKGLVTALTNDAVKYFINSTSNTLKIKDLRKSDITSTYFCNSSTGDIINFIPQVTPYLYQLDYLSVGVSEDYSIDMECFLLVGTENNQTTTWTWSFKGSNLPANDKYKFVNNNTQTKITINGLTMSDRGDYYCTASNSYGYYNRSIALKVKSRLAPVWPFLGVLGEAALLGIILLVTSKNGAKMNEDGSKAKNN